MNTDFVCEIFVEHFEQKETQAIEFCTLLYFFHITLCVFSFYYHSLFKGNRIEPKRFFGSPVERERKKLHFFFFLHVYRKENPCLKPNMWRH